ncbi:MAG: cob(I)yrinic acid a,c-diamide adenosyltransferase, partial [Alphaproteobacteria bacterium]|nr:cob(I)yrinic acid a,c-diamide adenosyltransferase [Alphaproteobacteria bacterium]
MQQGGDETGGEAELSRRHAEKMAARKLSRDKMMASKTITKGLLIVHTGLGKGKSTAAFGMAMRAIGHGQRVAIVQFVKGAWTSGEKTVFEKFPAQVSIRARGEGFT